MNNTQEYPENASVGMKRIVDFINIYAKQNKLKNKDVNILDWGCGKGEDVLWLLNKGYSVYGVDIDEDRIKGGMLLLDNNGHNKARLSTFNDNKTVLDEKHIDIIFSKQVLEHVRDINAVAKEMKRLLSDKGQCFHIFPAHMHINERHLFMPLIHWLPKNILRKTVIATYVYCGIHPKWDAIDKLSNSEKIDSYYRYSINNTYYRSFWHIKNIFEKAGFCVKFNVLDHPKLHEKQFISSLVSNGIIIRKIINFLLLTFVSIEVVLSSKNKISND